MKTIATIRATAKLLWLWLRHPLAGIAVVRFMLTCGDRIAALQAERESIEQDTARIKAATAATVAEQYEVILHRLYGQPMTTRLIETARQVADNAEWPPERAEQLVRRCAEIAVTRPNLKPEGAMLIAGRQMMEQEESGHA